MKTLNFKHLASVIAGLTLTTSLFGQVGFNANCNNSGLNATALGDETTASSPFSTALGSHSQATGSESLAAGHWSTASGNFSFALGARAQANSNHATALGLDVRANALSSFVLGTGIGNGAVNALQNNIANSLMIGFNSTAPTLFVGPSAGGQTTGNVGIGTSTPNNKLEVYRSENPSFAIASDEGTFQMAVADCNGCFASHAEPGDAVARILGNAERMIFATSATPSTGREFQFEAGNTNLMLIRDNGQVSIGEETITSGMHTNYALSVNGKIVSKEMVVTLSNWADYVFDSEYSLMPLEEVEQHIEEHHHLPNIPSAEEMVENGLQVGDANRMMMEKIEELTLYLIEQNKEIQALKEKNEKLEAIIISENATNKR